VAFRSSRFEPRCYKTSIAHATRSCPLKRTSTCPPALRGPGPSSKRDSLNAAPSPPPASPQPPYHAREFKIFFDFDSDYLPGRSTRVVGQAAGYAKLTKATAIEVSGYRGATLLSDGRRLEEKPNAGEVRAKKIAEILEGLGIPAVNVAVHWKSESPPADGVNDPLLREVIILVKPLAAGSEP
jgi:outer membrane protein OmpA-like peptidoglycan-associated protein